MNKIIIPVSYMGSGSSALTDVIAEFKGFQAKQGSFEYVFLHCPNGLFDLEMKLLFNNTTLRSDEALHSFQNTMQELYNKKYYWVGHYSKIVGPCFMEYTNAFIESLIDAKPEMYWYYQENTNTKMFIQLLKNKVLRLLSANHIKGKKPLLYESMWLSYVEPQSFYEKSKEYLNKIWKDLGVEENNIVLDQLLLPQNIHKMEHYFDDNAFAFVIDRDPRDVFIMNKYVWLPNGEPIAFPLEVEAFCECYRKLRQLEDTKQRKNVMRIHFEDLVYNYEDTIKSILSFLGLEEKDHLHQKTKFDPARSINNTQVFRAKAEYEKEALYIEKHLQEYLYAFPYKNTIDLQQSF